MTTDRATTTERWVYLGHDIAGGRLADTWRDQSGTTRWFRSSKARRAVGYLYDVEVERAIVQGAEKVSLHGTPRLVLEIEAPDAVTLRVADVAREAERDRIRTEKRLAAAAGDLRLLTLGEIREHGEKLSWRDRRALVATVLAYVGGGRW